MLSILIPTYNYNVYPLVKELHRQCLECGIVFEILCEDDFSNEFTVKNTAINSLEYCSFFLNKKNLGRGKNINRVAKKAKYEWLLILDCDTYPTHSIFIKKYIASIAKNNSSIIFGGIVYKAKRPEKSKLLRWVYGNKREVIPVKKRIKRPNSSALTSNLMLTKELLLQNPFDEKITKYGYEDLCFLTALEAKKIIVNHIENPTFHLNLETSIIFLNKTKTALENLKYIDRSNTSSIKDSKIISIYNILKRLKLIQFISFTFTFMESKITSNLLSDNPSIILFDLYKLGYFCTVQKKNNNIVL